MSKDFPTPAHQQRLRRSMKHGPLQDAVDALLAEWPKSRWGPHLRGLHKAGRYAFTTSRCLYAIARALHSDWTSAMCARLAGYSPTRTQSRIDVERDPRVQNAIAEIMAYRIRENAGLSPGLNLVKRLGPAPRAAPEPAPAGSMTLAETLHRIREATKITADELRPEEW